MPRKSNTNVDDSAQAADSPGIDSTNAAPAKKGRRGWLLIAIVGVLALIVGLLIGSATSSNSLDLCSYGIPNKTNSSLLDSVDAFRVVMVNVSYQEVNVTSQFCGNFTAQQNASIIALFSRSQLVKFLHNELAPAPTVARI